MTDFGPISFPVKGLEHVISYVVTNLPFLSIGPNIFTDLENVGHNLTFKQTKHFFFYIFSQNRYNVWHSTVRAENILLKISDMLHFEVTETRGNM